MSDPNSPPPGPLSGAQPSRWRRAISGGLNIIQHNPRPSPDVSAGKKDTDTAKAAHSRRREQVRRAQRNHRERKEQYIRSLENEVLALRSRDAESERERKALKEENEMLKSLLGQHHIAFPQRNNYDDPFAKVNVVQQPGGSQRLQVTMPEPNPERLPFGSPQSQKTTVDAPPAESLIPDISRYRSSSRSPSLSPHANDLRPLPPLPRAPSPLPLPKIGHPAGLDSHQIGIDFVLSLEQPCLPHTFPPLDASSSSSLPSTTSSSSSAGPTFHALTAQAPLLSSAPLPLVPTSTWKIPAVEIERLLDLSGGLNLSGELTPVQAWGRLVRMDSFKQLGLREINAIRDELAKGIRCYGFGAVMDEDEFERIVGVVVSGVVQ